MRSPTKWWDGSSWTKGLLASGGLIAAIALADWWTKPYFSLGLLYLFPIMLAARFLPRPALVALGVLCAGLSEVFSELDPKGRATRLTFETFALAGCGLFVSELLRSRRLIFETQQCLRALVETSPAAILIIDRSGVIELANQAAIDLFHFSGAALVGQPIGALVPELQNALIPGNGTQFRTSMRCQAHRIDGEAFGAEVWFSTYSEKGATKLAAIVADISEEKVNVLPSDTRTLNGSDRPALNSRQIAVLRLVLSGHTNNQIATQLDMTCSAVKNTLQQLFSKTGVHNRSQMVRAALERYPHLL